MTERSKSTITANRGCGVRLIPNRLTNPLRRAFRTALVLALVNLGTTGSFHAQAVQTADTPAAATKKPWEWSAVERLALRLNPANIAERQAEEDARYRSAGARPPEGRSEGVHSYAIDGKQHPELLLPHELFQSLLTGFVPDEQRQRRQRERLRPGIVAAGFDEGLFWAKLRSAASHYIDTYAYPTPASARAEGTATSLCREAFVALTNARHVFGEERFDRFLYEAVAPLTQIASATSARDPESELLFVAGGCQ